MWKHTVTIILIILTEIILHIIPQSFLLNLPKEVRVIIAINMKYILWFCHISL